MTILFEVLSVLAVLAIPYLAITLVDRRIQQKKRNETRPRDRVQTTIESANRTRVVL
jgi:hypothetical protein